MHTAVAGTLWLVQVRKAVSAWNKLQSPPISFVAQLGDLIDGLCATMMAPH